ncbi:PAS domain-containing protein [Marivirga sp. S37H4]|uniref:PAS domain-containing protein n=1 Tax=Marivirga aurantiaca TaxID=2802615 RepID=A0A934WYJ9_9BACT|nr:PAS domain-containing protein [Marivirga aurantiaca]MBK6265262.1 PAS domain-containing protein [Marivirga aurantiaca]
MKELLHNKTTFNVLFNKIENPILLVSTDNKVIKMNKAAGLLFMNRFDPENISEEVILQNTIEAGMANWKKNPSENVFEIAIKDSVETTFEVLEIAGFNHLILLGTKIKNQTSQGETEKLLKLLEKDTDLDGDTLARLLNEEEIDKLKLISENINDVICLHHPSNGRYLYASPSVEKIMGYTSKDLEGKVPYDFIHPDHFSILSNNLVNTQHGENTFPEKLELLFRKKDNSYQWFEGYSTPILNRKGEVILMLSCTRNIQERKMAEMERKERELIQQNLLSSSILLEKKKVLMKKVKDKVLEVEPIAREELRSVLNYIKETLKFVDEIEDFLIRFEKIHPEFYNQITTRFPHLTCNELQHLAFIKLGMASSEISRIKSIKMESLRVNRNRLKKKLGLENTVNLTEFIQSF